MQTPSPTDLRTAIQVLETLGERLTNQATDSILALHESPSSSHQAGQIEANAIKQTASVKLVSAQLKSWRDDLLQRRRTVHHHV